MHACSYLVVDQLFWSILVVFTPLLWLLAFCNLQHCALFAFLSCNSVKDDPLSMPNVGSDALPSSFFFRYFNSAILLSQSRETALTSGSDRRNMSQPGGGGGGGRNKMGNLNWTVDKFFDFHVAMYA